jgi:hypothetical protein
MEREDCLTVFEDIANCAVNRGANLLRRKSRHEVSNAVKLGTKERRIGVSGGAYGEILVYPIKII